ncbi:hypothetical protein [Diaphorobacter sp.]|uniref:hypothetical protein n=1 Tax=Diaphorobacter sp. TaxID=1934310 RepID=UPI0025842E6C|nr:hypothetical protein [Diaphorobacter sp.]
MPTTIQGFPINERTPALDLPLPHIDNWHEDDVPRLRGALVALDAACASLADLVAAKADAQAMATAVAELLASVDAINSATNSLADNKVGTVNGLPGPAVTLKPAHLGLGPANGPQAQAYAYDAQGRVSTVTTTVGGMDAVQTMAYDAQDRVSTVTTTYDGRTRTETYTYNANGTVASMAAVEEQA